MTVTVEIDFVPFDAVSKLANPAGDETTGTTLVLFAGENLAMSAATRDAGLAPALKAIERAAAVAKFKGKTGSTLDILAPQGLSVGRLLIFGTAPRSEDGLPDAETTASRRVSLGGIALGKLGGAERAIVLFDLPSGGSDPDAAADFALGAQLRAYKFDLYRTKAGDENATRTIRLTMALAAPEAAQKAWPARAAVANGVVLARDLVNEPPNVLYPEEFARRAEELTALGVEVETLDVPAMTKLGMGALLGVGQGSVRESRVVIMRWNGGRGQGSPVAFIGKGVCFDTGGISIKPAGGMEDMKGDMAGAACVVGLMKTLAERKAKVDVIGAIGLVENYARRQRPAARRHREIDVRPDDRDHQHGCGRPPRPRRRPSLRAGQVQAAFMIDLATLTGAILVALGTDHAGLFSNNDELSQRLVEAGQTTGEKVWRLPLGHAYDKLIDSKFADMKNTGGRHGGSITAAQFLQRFVNKVPWAHLDIAGTGMGAPSNDD